MLNIKELKVVMATLSKRRAWLRKALEDSSIDPKVRAENVESLQLLDSALKKLANSAPKPTQTTKSPPPPKPEITKRKISSIEQVRILIAEDDTDSAKLLGDILEDIGIKFVDVAADGMQAFDKIKSAEQPYDVILCDWDMPHLTGLEVHGKAKASNTLLGAHFVMVTAVSEASRIKQAVTQGVNDYIVKPIEIDVLEMKIKTALNIPEPESEAKEKAS